MNNDPIEIRKANRSDAGLVLQFIKDIAAYEKLSHEVVATEESITDHLFGSRQYAEVVIAYCGGSPAGFALYFHNFSTFVGKPGVYLEDLFVKPEYRKKGVGYELFMHVVRTAHERGCGRVEWAVLDWNEPAIDFYKKLGAVAMDEWTVFRLNENAINKLADTQEMQ